MAVGRLAHVSVAPGGYATVYNNSSGTPAVVSIVVGAAQDTTFNVRVTDASSYDFVNSTTIVTESYNTDDIRINSTTSSVISRQQVTSDTDNYTTEPKGLNYYLESNSTLYKIKGGKNSTTTWSTPTYVDLGNTKSFDVIPLVGTDTIRQFYSVNKEAYGGTSQFASVEEENYRKLSRATGTDPDGNTWTSSKYAATNDLDYYNCCAAWDQWWHKTGMDFMCAISVNDNNNYMTGLTAEASSITKNNRTSDSKWAGAFGTGSLPQPTFARPFPYIRMSGNVFVYDACGQGTDNDSIGYLIFSVNKNESASSITDALVENSTTRANGLRGNNTQSSVNYDGGKVIFCEYHPDDGCTYVLIRFTNTNQQMFKIHADTFFAYTSANYSSVSSSWWQPNMLTEDFDYATQGIERLSTSDWSFPTLTNAPFNSTNSTYRVHYIAQNRWAMIGWNTSSGARDILTSTDLKTWVSYDTSFSPQKYSVKSTNNNAVELLHDNTKFFFNEDNFVNLGTDGILESATNATVLERTGLMLDDGDKVIVQNTGSVSMSVQVMGYEGQE